MRTLTLFTTIVTFECLRVPVERIELGLALVERRVALFVRNIGGILVYDEWI
jgi:hypothetical protein